MTDEQPTPVRVAGGAADQLVGVVGKYRQLPMVLRWRHCGVPCDQAGDELLHIVLLRVVGGLDREGPGSQASTPSADSSFGFGRPAPRPRPGGCPATPGS